MKYVWLVALVGFLILESATAQIVSVWFAIGSLFAIIASLLNLNIVWQIVIFILFSAITLIVFKPFLKKKLLPVKEKTNADRNIGKKALVIEKIEPSLSKGQVKLDGMVWSAKSENDEIIEEGTTVTVSDIKGVKLVVK